MAEINRSSLSRQSSGSGSVYPAAAAISPPPPPCPAPVMAKEPTGIEASQSTFPIASSPASCHGRAPLCSPHAVAASGPYPSRPHRHALPPRRPKLGMSSLLSIISDDFSATLAMHIGRNKEMRCKQAALREALNVAVFVCSVVLSWLCKNV